MPKIRFREYLAAIALVLLPHAGAAQSGGAIAGTVRDMTDAVLPGVTVEVRSDALIEGVRSALTDETGQYRVIDLRPGMYSVTFTLSGFAAVKRDGIELSAGFTAAVNAELGVGAVNETITVTGASPIVDVQNVQQQRIMTRDVIESVPTGKAWQNFAVLVPGVTIRASTAAGGVGVQDVGGGTGNPIVRLTIHGSATQDQQIQIDGYSAGNLSGNGEGTYQMFIDGIVQRVLN